MTPAEVKLSRDMLLRLKLASYAKANKITDEVLPLQGVGNIPAYRGVSGRGDDSPVSLESLAQVENLKKEALSGALAAGKGIVKKLLPSTAKTVTKAVKPPPIPILASLPSVPKAAPAMVKDTAPALSELVGRAKSVPIAKAAPKVPMGPPGPRLVGPQAAPVLPPPPAPVSKAAREAQKIEAAAKKTNVRAARQAQKIEEAAARTNARGGIPEVPYQAGGPPPIPAASKIPPSAAPSAAAPRQAPPPIPKADDVVDMTRHAKEIKDPSLTRQLLGPAALLAGGYGVYKGVPAAIETAQQMANTPRAYGGGVRMNQYGYSPAGQAMY